MVQPGRKLRVAVDARELNRPHLRGMGKYLLELIRHSKVAQSIEWQLFSDRPDLPFHQPPEPGVSIRITDVPGYRIHAWEQGFLPIMAAGADILHCPFSRAPWLQLKPTVVTIHDTIPWESNEPSWDHGFYVDTLLPRAFKNARAIITGSHASQRDISRRWPEIESKLHVVYHGIGEEFLAVQPGPLSENPELGGVRAPYLLYVGGEIPRKRLSWAIDVYSAVADSGVSLVVCGLGPASHSEILQQVPESLRDGITFMPFVPQAAMPRLYQNAVALLFPSLAEGFGFPVLEAQAVGTPALFSPQSSLSELTGPAAVPLPATDLHAWTQSARRLVEDRRPGVAPRPDSREWARQFSWETSASKTLALYSAVAGRR